MESGVIQRNVFRKIPSSLCFTKVFSLGLFRLTLCLHQNTVTIYSQHDSCSVDALLRTRCTILFNFVARALLAHIYPILRSTTPVNSVNSQRVLSIRFLPSPHLVLHLLHLSSFVSQPLQKLHIWVLTSLLQILRTLRQNQSSNPHQICSMDSLVSLSQIVTTLHVFVVLTFLIFFSLYNLSPSITHFLLPLSFNMQRSVYLHIFPLHTARALASFVIVNHLSPLCQLANTSQIPTSNYFTLRPTPTKSTWAAASADDDGINNIMVSLANKEPLSKDAMNKLNVAYKHGVVNKLFQILEGKLVYYEKILISTSCILRIVVPPSLRRDIFYAFHTSPATENMGEYKTLYRLKVRSFQPHMRKDIKAWVKACACFNLTNRWWRSVSNV